MKMNETNGIIKQIRGMRQKNVTVETVDLRRLHKMHLYHSFLSWKYVVNTVYLRCLSKTYLFFRMRYMRQMRQMK